MQAKDALKQSERQLIMADTLEALVIIQHQFGQDTSSDERFVVRIVPHDAHGWHDGSGLRTTGLYESLEKAITEAEAIHGISEESWMPVNRYATAVLGPVLIQDRPVDISLLVKSTSARGEE